MPGSTIESGQQSAVTFSEAIAQRLQHFASDYATNQAPRSPNPLLTGNAVPEVSRLKWLKGRAKCNQFVGDVLTQARFAMPHYQMTDGSYHYVNAEALPRFTSHFQKLQSAAAIRPGDLVVLDRLDRQGENGAHVEIVEAVYGNQLLLAGAHATGAGRRTFSLESLGSYRAQESAFRSAGLAIMFLRPIRRLLSR